MLDDGTHPRISVVICDDDPIARHALAATLERVEELEIVSLVGTAGEVLTRLEQERADVVLMELAPPGMHGTDATRQVRAKHPGTAVLMMTSSGTVEQVREAIRAGASGFLLKPTATSAVVAAVRAAAEDAGIVLAPRLAAQLAAARPSADGPAEEHHVSAAARAAELGLSGREVQVLTLLCAAESNAGIAQALSLSESTVKTHVSSLLTKLDGSSRLQIALTAFALGLAEPPRSVG